MKSTSGNPVRPKRISGRSRRRTAAAGQRRLDAVDGRRRREVGVGTRGASEAPQWPAESPESTYVAGPTLSSGSEVVVLPIGLSTGCGMHTQTTGESEGGETQSERARERSPRGFEARTAHT